MEETSLLPTQPVLNQNPHYKLSLYKILIISLVVSFAFAAGYYFSFKESEKAKQSLVLPQRMVMVPQAQRDKKLHVLKPSVPVQKAADDRQTETDKINASKPMIESVSLSASQMGVTLAQGEGISSPAIKEHKHAASTPTVAHIDEKPAQSPEEEKKVIMFSQQEAKAMYYVNVASFKHKENAELAIKNLQKKGYEPEVDTVTVKDTTWYRVTLGHFQTRDEAQSYIRKLQSRENIIGDVMKKK